MTVLIGLLTPVFMERSASGTFLVFASACALGYLWSTYFVPETANVSLEEMDAVFGSSAGREDIALKHQVRILPHRPQLQGEAEANPPICL